MIENRELELYFHIPFCVRKCLYCDFLSGPADSEEKRRYMEALIRETKERAEACREYLVTSVFLGGGTPSVVETQQMEELLRTVKENYRLTPDAELTIEVNPGTVDKEKLARYRGAGLNRLSIGLQSADDRELLTLGRVHTWQQFLETYQGAREVGFANVNVDVMSALPGQSLESYLATLEKVLLLKPSPEHISAYSLILEEGTRFFEMAEAGSLELSDEDTDRAMYHETKRILAKAGYTRYEISNYAKEGFFCRHNSGYWKRREYMGFGLGAASLIDNTRFNNTRNIKRYLDAPTGCRENGQELSIKEQMEEFMFLGLRLTEGVDPAEFSRCFGCTPEEVYGDVIERNIREGLLARKRYQGSNEEVKERLALTEFGLDVSNYVMQQFML